MRLNKLALISGAVLLVLALAACSSAEIAATAIPDVPANTPIPTPEPTSPGVASEAPGACRHAFYPLRSDMIWTYQIVSPVEAAEGSFELSYENITADSFDALMSLRDPETDEIYRASGTWYCSDDGIISSDLAAITFLTAADVTVETLDYDGITLLPASQWEVGKSWDSSYQVNENFDMEGMEISAAMTVDITSTIAAIEEISVSAGTYSEAYRVNTKGSMIMDLGGDMGASLSDIPIEYNTWYVRDIGMVRQETLGVDADGTYVELFSLE